MLNAREDGRNSFEKQTPFSQEEERANIFTDENREFGLLDVVILDALANNDVCHH